MREVDLTAVGEACKAIRRPIPGVKEKTFDGSGYSADGTLISASVVLHCTRAGQREEHKHVHKHLSLLHIIDRPAVAPREVMTLCVDRLFVQPDRLLVRTDHPDVIITDRYRLTSSACGRSHV